MVYFEFLANGLITIFIISSTWLIVVMAAERYIAVCHPLRARKLISLRRTRASIVLVFVACGLTTIAIFLEKSIEPCLADGRRVLVVRARSEQWVTLRRILWSLFFDFIPCAALVYFNLCLIVQIRRAKRLREQMTPPRSSLLRWTAGSATSAAKAKRAGNRTPHTTATGATGGELDIMRTQGGVGGINQRTMYLTRPDRSSGKRGVKYARYVSFVHGKSDHTSNSGDGEGRSRSSHSSHSHRSSCSDVDVQLCENENDTTSGCGRSSGAVAVGGSSNGNALVNNNHRRKRTPSPNTNKHSIQKVRIVINGASNSSASAGRVSSKHGGSTSKGRRPSDSALNSVTATLVAVVIFFLVLVSPSELLKFSISYTGASACQERMVLYVTNFMQVLNFSLNFVLYCAVNKTFRHTLHGLICCCWLTITG
ncbi:FMRFamide receptor [Elysia marginata]|uniref:FMRFamide receptor n=1 Tax=Elysia marginata TaxID=1093978 RepID=A0AAV4GXA3_9GAST|nr:FMRFamide receptor [Elysia marginata]